MTTATEAEVPADDEFSKMFDEIAKLGDEAPAPAAEAAPEPVAVETPEPAAEPSPEPVAVDPAPEPAAEPAPAPAPRASDDDIIDRFARAVADRQPQTSAPAPQAQAPAETPPLFSTDEQALLSAYEKDWPDVAKAEALRRRGEYQQLVGYIFNQVQARLAPVEQQMQGATQRSHLGDLYNLIPDYNEVRQPVLDWIGKQPPYLRSAFEQVASQGTPEEVADLVGRYRSAAGVSAPSAPAPAPVAPATPAPALRKAAAALAPVRSSRSGAVQQANPDDYDGAFAAFIKGD
jgi:hypothetical protein